MKKYLSLLSLAVMLLASCEKSPDGKSLEVSPKNLEFGAYDSQSQTVTVTATDVEWDFLIQDADMLWLSAEKNGDKLIVTAKDNNSKDSRQANITVKPKSDSDVKSQTVSVTQKGSDKADLKELKFDKASLTFEAEGAPAQDIVVTMEGGDFKWTAAPEENVKEWLHVAVDGNKITVTVGDYKNTTKQRVGNIVVTPEDSNINSKSIRVTQNALVLPPSFSIDPSTDISVEAIVGNTINTIKVNAVNTDWNVKTLNEKEVPMNLEWLTVKANKSSTGDGNSVTVTLKNNDTDKSRTAYVQIIPVEEGLQTYKIKVSQKATQSIYSTLEGDEALDITDSNVGVYPVQAWDTDTKSARWDIKLLSGSVTYDPSWGKFEGTGGYLSFDLLHSEPFGFNPEKEYYLNPGVYTVDADLTNIPGTIDMGYVRSETGIKSGLWYFKMESNNIVAISRIISGTVTVSKSGSYNTKFVVDLKDDKGNKITGTYIGELSIKQISEPADPVQPPKPGEDPDPGGEV